MSKEKGQRPLHLKKHSTIILNPSKINQLREKVNGKSLGLKYDVNDIVEILRSSGKWQKATVVRLDPREKCYWVQFNALNGKISEKGIDFCDEGSYIRDCTGKRRSRINIEPSQSSYKGKISQFTELKRSLEVEYNSLKTKLNEAIVQKDFISAGKIQEDMNNVQANLTATQRDLELTKEQYAKAKEKRRSRINVESNKSKVKGSVTQLSQIVRSLQAECNQHETKLRKVIAEKDFASASKIQKDIEASEAKLATARRDLKYAKDQAAKQRAAKEKMQKILKDNVTQLTEVVRSLDAGCILLETKLQDAINKKDFIDAGKIQEEYNIKQEKLKASRKKLESAKKELRYKPTLKDAVKGDVVELNGLVTSLELGCCLLELKLKEAIITKNFINAEKVQTEYDTKNGQLIAAREGFESAKESLLEISEDLDEASRKHLTKLVEEAYLIENECNQLNIKLKEALSNNDFMAAKTIREQFETKNSKLCAAHKNLKSAKEVLSEKPKDLNADQIHIESYILTKKLEKLQRQQKEKEEKEEKEKKLLEEKTRLLENQVEALHRQKSNSVIIERRRSSVQAITNNNLPTSMPSISYSVGDIVDVQRSNLTWVPCTITNVDYETEVYRCEYGNSFKLIPFMNSSLLLRPNVAGPIPRRGSNFATATIPTIHKSSLSETHDLSTMQNELHMQLEALKRQVKSHTEMYSIGENIEVKRRNGEWTKAKITSIEDSKYRCEYNGIFKLVPFSDVGIRIRKIKLRRSSQRANSLRTSQLRAKSNPVSIPRANSLKTSHLRANSLRGTGRNFQRKGSLPEERRKTLHAWKCTPSIKPSSSPSIKSPQRRVVARSHALQTKHDGIFSIGLTEKDKVDQILGYHPVV